MDLVLRKVPIDGGAVVSALIAEMVVELETMRPHDELAQFREELAVAIQGLGETSSWLGETLIAGDLRSALAGASPYLRQFGIVLGGWLMARAAVAALAGPAGFDPAFLKEKVGTARFYGEQLLPTANGLFPAVKGGVDLLDSAIL
jgi:hypothetical protein